jgi:hypothetical protein
MDENRNNYISLVAAMDDLTKILLKKRSGELRAGGNCLFLQWAKGAGILQQKRKFF